MSLERKDNDEPKNESNAPFGLAQGRLSRLVSTAPERAANQDKTASQR